MDNKENMETGLASEKKLAMAMDLYEEMETVDTAGLQHKVETKIHRIKTRMRRRRMILNIAAALIPVFILTGVLIYRVKSSQEEIPRIAKYTETVKIILPDGSQISLEDITYGGLAPELAGYAVRDETGSLNYRPDQTSAEPVYHTIEIPRGTRYDLVLADGTHVWLNSDSRLRYPSSFTGEERRVYLEGEGYFEVSRDTGQPFVVETKSQNVTVLGTSFNISAYGDEAKEYTTLVSGTVAVRSVLTDTRTVLDPDQQAEVNAAGGGLSKRSVNALEMTAWKNGAFVLENNTTEQIMRKLARWYDIEYVFEDQQARGYIAKGSLPIRDDITTILEVIESSGMIKFEIKGKTVKVSSKK